MGSEDVYQEFKDFLSSHKITSRDNCTHTNMHNKHKYSIDDRDIKEFWRVYSNVLTKYQVSITEKPRGVGPLRCDFDLKQTSLDRQYTYEIVESIIDIYQKEIRKIVDSSRFDTRYLYALLLEKKAPRKVTVKPNEIVIKDGFHIHFPYFVCDSWIQECYLGNVVAGALRSLRIFDDIDVQWERDNISSKTWLMYSSSKDLVENKEPFLITRCYDENLSITTLDVIFRSESIGGTKGIEWYLPRFLSIRYPLVDEAPIKSTIISKREESRSLKNRYDTGGRSLESTLADLKYIKDTRIMDLLSSKRKNQHNEWLSLGRLLYDIGQGLDEAFDIWLEFSTSSSKWDENSSESYMRNIWDKSFKIRSPPKGLGLLRYFAKIDSPDEYKAKNKIINKNKLLDSISYSTSRSPMEGLIAMYIGEYYEGRFICSSAKNNTWYEYRGHRWHLLDDGMAFIKMLLGEVTPQYLTLKRELEEKANDDIGRSLIGDNSERPKEADYYRQLSMKCLSIIERIQGKPAFQKAILEASKPYFHDDKFILKLDRNPNILCFENGVLDLNEMVFRDGQPDDYCSMSTGICFPTDSEDTIFRHSLMCLDNFIEEIFPNQAIREYWLAVLSTCLHGGNMNKLFPIAVGEKWTGKTTTFSLIASAFGPQYCVKLKAETMLEGYDGSAGSAEPQLIKILDSRIAIIDEITEDERIKPRIFKLYTGNDTVDIRDLFQKGKDMVTKKPLCTIWLQCNNAPTLPGYDDAVAARTKCIVHESRFTDDISLIPKTKSERIKKKIFRAKKEIERDFPIMAPALMYKLFERYKQFVREGHIIKEPPEVTEPSSRYIFNNDVYLQFIEDCLERDEESSLTVRKAFEQFTLWWKRRYYGLDQKRGIKITMNILETALSNRKKLGASQSIGKSKTKRAWQGWKIKEEES